MALDFTPVEYVDGETVIRAQNLNDIQEAITELEADDSVATLKYTEESANVIRFNDGTNRLYPQNRWFAFKDYQGVYLSSAGTRTFTLVSGQVYLLILGRQNSSTTANTGFYVVQAHSGASSVLAIASSNVATVSINALTLTITTTSNYVSMALIPVRDV